MAELGSIKAKEFLSKLKMEKGKRYRVAFPWVIKTSNGDKAINVEKYEIFQRYDDDKAGIRATFFITDDAEFNARVSGVMGNVKNRYATIVMIYDAVNKETLGPVTLKPLVFPDKFLAMLQKLNEETPIHATDFELSTSDGMNIDIIPKKDCIYMSETYKNKFDHAFIKQEIENIIPNLETAVARTYTKQEIANTCGFKDYGVEATATAGTSEPATKKADFDDIDF